ncbi:uncharacterized protein LOC118460698 [Anopheles albimanus]|uniref:uncharacterized protein LOC118460698 n=1 Tax=Anopheles albimanus TaxID=7167 RepID=UPI00163FF550|nr:uncharacterized protein LOC118460698 [Anopheles albimanus]XP_035781108.1 uncharacterized protein LOC118460698 [Anopheles albimanus]
MDNLQKRDSVASKGARKKAKVRRVGKPIHDWPTSWTDRLARAVQQFPCIYDPASELYKNVASREYAWNQIGSKIGVSADLAKAKWRTGRDNYTRFKRASERSPNEVSHLSEFYKCFQFLDKCARGVARPINSEPQDTISTSVEALSVQQDAESSMQADQHEAISICSTVEDSTMPPPPEQPASRSVTIDEGVMHRLLTQLENTSKNSQDALDLMFTSFAATTRQFTPTIQGQIKLKIMQIIVNAETEMAEQEQRNGRSNGVP